MSLLQHIKDSSLAARKAHRPEATFLVTLYSEAAKVGKDKRNGETTDEEVVQVLRRFKVGSEANIQFALKQNGPLAQHQIDQANMEIVVVDQFLPVMMSEAELTIEILEIINRLEDRSVKSLGKVMSQLKEAFPGLYDGAMASKLVKEVLSR